MGSINAQKFANKVTEKVRSGKLVNMGEIMREVGYSHNTSLQPTKITRTKTYTKLMRPLIDGMQEEINRLKDNLSKTDLNDVDYRSKAYGLDLFIKNYQLLSGGATERQVFVLPSEVMNKNQIEQSKDGSTEPLNKT